MSQAGGCHFDRWIVPSERDSPEDYTGTLLIYLENNN